MKAYAIAAETVTDAAMFDTYRNAAGPTLEPFGGRFLVRGGQQTVLDGDWPYRRMVVIEFPSRAAAEDWYRSEAYQKIVELRIQSTTGSLIIVDGPA